MKSNIWPLIGTWRGEEITATYTATGVRDWIGHPDVPGGMQEGEAIEDIRLHSVELLGRDIPLFEFGPEAQERILGQYTEVDKWENAE